MGAPEQTRTRPELTSALQSYVDLHRHAAARAALINRQGLALRLLLAHAICGAPCWSVRPEPQAARSDSTRESLETSTAEAAFDERRRAVLALLGCSPEEPYLIGGNTDPFGLVGLFSRLSQLPDPALLDIAAIVMGESLAAASPAVDAVGLELGLEIHRWWRTDDAFFEELRDREVLTAIVAEVAGDAVALANSKETGKALKAVIRDHLDGTNGRPKVKDWVPKWMRFPPSAYTARGGVAPVAAHALAAAAAAIAPASGAREGLGGVPTNATAVSDPEAISETETEPLRTSQLAA